MSKWKGEAAAANRCGQGTGQGLVMVEAEKVLEERKYVA
jgi:hypothetical protein